jgi:hypothetical protein
LKWAIAVVAFFYHLVVEPAFDKKHKIPNL